MWNFVARRHRNAVDVRDGKQRINTIISGLFRAAVVLHFACLYILIFELKTTFIGTTQYMIAVGLSIVMAVIAVLLVIDMATRKDQSRRFAKVTDGAIGFVWIAFVVMLYLHPLRLE